MQWWPIFVTLCETLRKQVDTQETPIEKDAAAVVRSRLSLEPTGGRRFLTGLCHFVFLMETAGNPAKVAVRVATPSTRRLLAGGVYWNNLPRPIGVPLPRMLAVDLRPSEIQFPFVILEYLTGVDLHAVYPELSHEDKFHVTSETVGIQQKVSALPIARGFGYAVSYEDAPQFPTWSAALAAILEQAVQRINGRDHPGRSYLDQTSRILNRHEAYFAAIRPMPFLDDTTTKNVLVDNGRLAGVVDVDQVCFGDPLLTIGLTEIALLANGYDLDYSGHWMSILGLTNHQRG